MATLWKQFQSFFSHFRSISVVFQPIFGIFHQNWGDFNHFPPEFESISAISQPIMIIILLPSWFQWENHLRDRYHGNSVFKKRATKKSWNLYKENNPELVATLWKRVWRPDINLVKMAVFTTASCTHAELITRRNWGLTGAYVICHWLRNGGTTAEVLSLCFRIVINGCRAELPNSSIFGDF